MNLLTLLSACLLVSGCASSMYTRDKDGRLIYADTQRMPSEIGKPYTPYPVFLPPLAGIQPDSVSGPVKRPTNSYPVFIPIAP